MDCLKLFQTHEEYEAFVSGRTMVKPNVSHCVQDNEVHYNPIKTMADEYLTFIALENGTLRVPKFVQYSLDNGETWSESVMEEEVTELAIATGDKIMCKFEVTQEMIEQADYPITFLNFRSSGRVNVQGNIMSMLYGDNFVGQTTLINNLTLGNVFRRCKVVSAENLVLPATTLTDRCYAQMFMECEYLTTAPELPATTLADSCYTYMFNGCTSLTVAPKLPAITLVNDCYDSMFNGCTSLTLAPELPATTLASLCYMSMFEGCTSLVTIPELSATTLAEDCYSSMFYGCESLTNAAVIPNTVKPVGGEYCCGMYAQTNVQQSSDYDASAWSEECE